MKRNLIIILIIAIILIGIIVGILIYKNGNKKSSNIVQNKINQVSEKVTDECTEEWSKLNETAKKDIETNSSEEKISPNCLITIKKYYKGCGHTTNEYLDISKELVNKTKEDLQKKYEGYEIQEFSSTGVTLYKEYDGECGEHYVVREDNGKISIYRINENKEEELYEKTEISIDYLTETDKMNIKNGINVNGKEKLNQLIEDFE